MIKKALSKNDALKLARDFLARCLNRHAIQKADLFGSFTRGTACEQSDIDLAVILEKEQASKDSIYAEDFEIFHEAQQFTSLLEVVCFPERAFAVNRGALIQKRKKEGIPVM